MFDLSLGEVLFTVMVAVIFIGPKDLPVVLRAVAKGIVSLRALSRDMRNAFDELAKESGIKEAADAIHDEVRMIQGDDGQWYESYAPLEKNNDR